MAIAQRAPAGNWAMVGNDPGQTGQQTAEREISPDSIAQFKFLWKIKLGEGSREPQSFSEPLLAPRLINAQGFKDIVFGSSSNTLYAVDSELGSMIWTKKFDTGAAAPAGCATSSLGLTMEPPVVINFSARPAAGAPRPARPVQAGPLAPSERRLGVPAGGGGFGLKGIYVLTSDGALHEQVLTTGADFAPSTKFLSGANASAFGLNMVGKTIYTAVGRGCGSVPNGVYAIDLDNSSDPVHSYGTSKVRTLGLPSIAADGTAFVVTGAGTSTGEVHANSVVALDKDMKVKDWYTPAGGASNIEHVSPVTFTDKGRELVIAPGRDGSFVLLDAASLGGADHHTPLSTTASYFKGKEKHVWDGFATAEGKDGSVWVFASLSGAITTKDSAAKMNGATTHGGIVAFRVEDGDGKPVLTPAWISHDMVNPAPPRFANGVVVALSSGNATTHAQLYVLDAATGAEIYASKDAVPTYARFSGVSIGDGHAFFTDHENTLYSFGIAMIH
ncbi:MAG: hypothetical protein ABI357_00295 [Granulicella sp.]